MSIVQLVRPERDDIPALLEVAAAEMRAGEDGDVTLGVGVFLNEEGEIMVRRWGRDAEPLRAMGLLHSALVGMASK